MTETFTGIAKLTQCEFVRIVSGPLSGEVIFIAKGEVLSPKTTRDVANLETRIQIPLAENMPHSSLLERMQRVVNEMRKLGAVIALSDYNYDLAQSEAYRLTELQPLFRIRLWLFKGTAQIPRQTWVHAWEGLV